MAVLFERPLGAVALGREACLAMDGAGRVVAAEGKNEGAVEPEGLPCERVSDRAELASQPFAEVVLEEPCRVLSEVSSRLGFGGLWMRCLALADPVRRPLQLSPVTLHGE